MGNACWAQSDEDRPRMKEVLVWLDKLILSCPRPTPTRPSGSSNSYAANPSPMCQTYSPTSQQQRHSSSSPYSSFSGTSSSPYSSYGTVSASNLPSYATIKGTTLAPAAQTYMSQSSGTTSPPYLQSSQSSSDIPRYATVNPKSVPSYLSG